MIKYTKGKLLDENTDVVNGKDEEGNTILLINNDGWDIYINGNYCGGEYSLANAKRAVRSRLCIQTNR